MRLQLWTAVLFSLGPLLPIPAHCQTPGTTPALEASAPVAPTGYDVVSIHEHNPDDHSSSWRSTPDGLSLSGIPLKALAAGAYDVKLDMVSGGPAWLAEKRFDVSAKVLPADDGKPVKLSNDQRNLLFQNLLADRFHLTAHVERKDLPIYELVIAKGGLKMKPSPPLPTEEPASGSVPSSHKPHGASRISLGRFEANAYPARDLASQLGYLVRKTVVDRTGLTGNYDFTLEYTPEDLLAKGNDPAPSSADLKPDIFTALQEQLGLKLVPSKGPVRTLFIDRAELPTPN